MRLSKFQNVFHLVQFRVASLVLLAFVCFGLTSQYVHLHHLHKDDALALEISYHPLQVAAEHGSAHHHEDEKSSHSQDNHEQYEYQPDWNTVRAQLTSHLSPGGHSLTFSHLYLFPEIAFAKLLISFDDPFRLKSYLGSFAPVRGPPC